MRRYGRRFGGILVWTLLGSATGFAFAQAAAQGITIGEFFRMAAVGIAVLTLILLVLVEFVFRDRLPRSTYYLLLFVGLLAFPAFTVTGTTTTVFEETKSVESCSTCHIMEPFVEDMRDPVSASLAARHYRHQWIETDQCYGCHTTYGAHGTIAGKRDGFRHWLLYVTRTWEEPIRYAGSYPNQSCTSCHVGTPAFRGVPSHSALADDLRSDRVACSACHGPPHPVPGERGQQQIPGQEPSALYRLEPDQLNLLLSGLSEETTKVTDER